MLGFGLSAPVIVSEPVAAGRPRCAGKAWTTPIDASRGSENRIAALPLSATGSGVLQRPQPLGPDSRGCSVRPPWTIRTVPDPTRQPVTEIT
jgi:hypothetical protein